MKKENKESVVFDVVDLVSDSAKSPCAHDDFSAFSAVGQVAMRVLEHDVKLVELECDAPYRAIFVVLLVHQGFERIF